MSLPITNIFKGITGEFEVTRTLGAIGVLVYIVGAHIFEGYEVFIAKKGFDLIAYCAAFPSGLAVAIGIIATAAGQKDKAVATAQAVQNTGALPTSGAST